MDEAKYALHRAKLAQNQAEDNERDIEEIEKTIELHTKQMHDITKNAIEDYIYSITSMDVLMKDWIEENKRREQEEYSKKFMCELRIGNERYPVMERHMENCERGKEGFMIIDVTKPAELTATVLDTQMVVTYDPVSGKKQVWRNSLPIFPY